jgi:hypothetical protein
MQTFKDNDNILNLAEKLGAEKVLLIPRHGSNTYEYDRHRAWTDFDILPGTRVQTPRGSAKVVGVCESHLWFQIDGDAGPSYWYDIRPHQGLPYDFIIIDDNGIVEETDRPIKVSETPVSFLKSISNFFNEEAFSDVEVIAGR